ncbi:ankyrin repeat domain-containing protein [Bacillus sp. APMAM]|uniref:Ankyrin repeat domain-containing protein n=1 Tax=Anoxybacillus andreesenii TaxID=1325932 RepID=A0ABT9VAK8_9BACL|nr:ankyrin repeat domain-containing protein [Robertmurraya andreesenii]MBB2483123.1 ankyrin repeat domain-containing protein [Bacillus sp. APMAM]MDQ0157954.1 hypothetical protein [Robertmurraya andreesenii]RTZ53440.1 ankyrin repeat domain-containing protein [Bacillus sp. SAJ1]
MRYLKLALLIVFLLVGCQNVNLSSKSAKFTNSSGGKSESVVMGVSGDSIKAFIKQSKLLGLQEANPDKLFFVHLVAPGYSIQLEGKNPDKMTGAMIDISYDSENYGMGRGNIAALLGVLLNKESSLEAIKWITNQYVDSEISLKKGITPKETKFEVDNLVVDFFPPTSLDNLSATVLMNAKDKIKKNAGSSNGSNSNTETGNIVSNEESDTQENNVVSGNSNNINATDDYGVTKLARASGEGNSDLVRELLNQGADPNIYKEMGEPPLLWAIRSNNDDIVKILLDAGANPNVKTSEGVTPLKIARENGDKGILKYLEEYGAKE